MHETCSNCQVTIGKLETAYIWQQNVVCSNCYRRLSVRSQIDRDTRNSPPVAATPSNANGLRTAGGIILLIAVVLAMGGGALIPLSSLLFVVGVVLLIAGLAKG